MKLPIITTFSNLQLRLGYLKVLAAVGDRAPTTTEAFERKLSPLFPPPPPKKTEMLRKSTASPPAPSYIEQMFAQEKPVRRGLLNRNNLHELIIFGKAFQFLHPTNCSLFEISVVLRSLMGPAAVKAVAEGDAHASYNPMTIGGGNAPLMERAFFFLLVVSSDLPTALVASVAADSKPFHLKEDFRKAAARVQGENAVRTSKSATMKIVNLDALNSPHRGSKQVSRSLADDSLTAYAPDNFLLKSYQLIAPIAENHISIANWREEWRDYFEGTEPTPAAGLGGTKVLRMGKESSFRHHAAPRVEFLVDLNLLELVKTAEHDAEPLSYAANDHTRRFAKFMRQNFLEQQSTNAKLDVSQFLRRSGIQWFSTTYAIQLRTPSPDEPLLFLLDAYHAVKRDIGTTPMWTTALMASLLALDAGVLLEAADLYALASRKAQEVSAGIRLSGGSRFDGEFLIGISPELMKTRIKSTSS